MKSLLINILIAFILIISTSSTLAMAQTTDTPVDESNIIFSGCRLSNLVKNNQSDPIVPLTKEQIDGKATNIIAGSKQKYIQSCLQEIIRFIIIIASLAAIIKIAASGVAMLDPTGSKASQKLSSSSTITNLVIGLFLLIVGWNIIPILNQSFNNADFLNLPGVNYCSVEKGCVSEYSTQANNSKSAIEEYLKAEKEKKATLNNSQKLEIIAGIKAYCDNKTKDKYKTEFETVKILNSTSDKICTEKYEANLTEWMKKGDSTLEGSKGGDASVPTTIDTLSVAYNDAVSNYKILFTGGKTPTDAEGTKAKDALIAACSADKIKQLEDTRKDIKDVDAKKLEDALKIRDTIIANCKILSGTDKAAITKKLEELSK